MHWDIRLGVILHVLLSSRYTIRAAIGLFKDIRLTQDLSTHIRSSSAQYIHPLQLFRWSECYLFRFLHSNIGVVINDKYLIIVTDHANVFKLLVVRPLMINSAEPLTADLFWPLHVVYVYGLPRGYSQDPLRRGVPEKAFDPLSPHGQGHRLSHRGYLLYAVWKAPYLHLNINNSFRW